MLNPVLRAQVYGEATKIATNLTEVLVKVKGNTVSAAITLNYYNELLAGVYKTLSQEYEGLAADADKLSPKKEPVLAGKV